MSDIAMPTRFKSGPRMFAAAAMYVSFSCRNGWEKTASRPVASGQIHQFVGMPVPDWTSRLLRVSYNCTPARLVDTINDSRTTGTMLFVNWAGVHSPW